MLLRVKAFRVVNNEKYGIFIFGFLSDQIREEAI